MKIKEQHINAVLDMIEEDDFDMEAAVQKIDKVLPTILSYSMSENFDLLTEEEVDYFKYLGVTILITILNNVDTVADKSEEQIAAVEEKVWAIMEENKSKKFNERINVFFENTKEEDLMAFVEDGLTPEENDFVSAAGRELMFVGLTTMVEVLSN
jgi:hypothetical protein